MNNAAAVQVMDGPSASVVHHLAAWVQVTLGIDAVSALGVVLGGGGVGLIGVLCSAGYAWERRGGRR